MSRPGPRQTKKQKKSLAFRTRQKTGKKKNEALDDEDALGFPVDENQDLAGLAGLPLEAEEVSPGCSSGGRKGKAQDIGHHKAQPDDPRKRKREGEDIIEEKPRKKPRVRPVASESGVEDDSCPKTVEVKKGVQPQRFILFVGTFCPRFVSQDSSASTIGNLKYSTTRDAILVHFSSCGTVHLGLDTHAIAHTLASGPPPTVRLPTPKATHQPSKSKGYAFLEFTDKKALQNALRLHHSELEGREINVELTAGGGGKSEHRVKKLQERNKGLHEQRVLHPRILSPMPC